MAGIKNFIVLVIVQYIYLTFALLFCQSQTIQEVQSTHHEIGESWIQFPLRVSDFSSTCSDYNISSKNTLDFLPLKMNSEQTIPTGCHGNDLN